VNIKIEVTFRLLNLDKFQAITLFREVDGVTYDHHPEKICFVGSVSLNRSLDNLD
jgi:hypothetical protein